MYCNVCVQEACGQQQQQHGQQEGDHHPQDGASADHEGCHHYHHCDHDDDQDEDHDDKIMVQGSFSTFMQKEIFEQPESVVNTMRGRVNFDTETVVLGGLQVSTS